MGSNIGGDCWARTFQHRTQSFLELILQIQSWCPKNVTIIYFCLKFQLDIMRNVLINIQQKDFKYVSFNEGARFKVREYAVLIAYLQVVFGRLQ